MAVVISTFARAVPRLRAPTGRPGAVGVQLVTDLPVPIQRGAFWQRCATFFFQFRHKRPIARANEKRDFHYALRW